MAEIKAKITVAKRRRMREAGVPVAVGPDKGENAYIKSPLSGEELKVVEAYRKWKRARVQEGEAAAPADDGAEAPATNVTAESRNMRILRLKRKIERRRRVEGLKRQLAEKRNAEKPDALRSQALALKERIQKVRKALRTLSLREGAPGAAPMAPPPDASSPPMGAAAPGADGMPGAIPNLPPEITAEIQNIATAAQSLAQMAGVAPEAPQPGADLGAGIPPEGAAPGSSGMLPEKAQRIARIKALLEKKKAEKGDDKKKEKKAEKEDEKDEKGKKKFPFSKKKESWEDNEANRKNTKLMANKLMPLTQMIPDEFYADEEEDEDGKLMDSVRNRATARREALQKIRARAMNERSYEAEEASDGDVKGFVKNALDLGQRGYELNQDRVIQQAGVKHDGASPSMPGRKEATSSISPARTWPAKDLKYGGKVPDSFARTPDYNPVRKSGGQPRMPGQGDKGAVTKESVEQDWSEKNIDHFLERKELNFRDLLKSGRLG